MIYSKLYRTLIFTLFTTGALNLFAAGTLKPKASGHQAIQIQDHDVNVVINNGFSRTEVNQTFFNPNDVDLEATYTFPVPKNASLSEFNIFIGETAINGEVLPLPEAHKIYEEEKAAGNDAGLATKKSYTDYQFQVSPVRAGDTTRIRFVYYQPIDIDTGIGRYIYPLEDGGTDEVARGFWDPNTQVEQSLTFNVVLKTAWPVSDVRIPGFENEAIIDRKSEGEVHASLDLPQAKLTRDLVFYYRLEQDLPGRVEVISYRADDTKPGTFMMVVTPGMDLQPLNRGSDYVFVLDISGSMNGKLHILTDGVSRAIGNLKPHDRFRIVIFSDRAREITSGWQDATLQNVEHTALSVKQISTEGGTNLHAGLSLGLKSTDSDRATSLILVTDAVANVGEINPAAYKKLMETHDIRVFGFLLGNQSNWPLMKTISDASGGFYASISNADDILGQIMLAKSKVTFESLHHVDFKLSGVKTFDTTQNFTSKIYRGQQLVIFGRYGEGGKASVKLNASLTGEDKTYTTNFEFPELDDSHPELERLWAMSFIEDLEQGRSEGQLNEEEAAKAIVDLGVAYQLVTDETGMVVLSDDRFAARGIERRNEVRVARENAARANRDSRPAPSHRVDTHQPMYQHNAPSVGGGGGGGAMDPLSALFALVLAGLAFAALKFKP